MMDLKDLMDLNLLLNLLKDLDLALIFFWGSADGSAWICLDLVTFPWAPNPYANGKFEAIPNGIVQNQKSSTPATSLRLGQATACGVNSWDERSTATK